MSKIFGFGEKVAGYEIPVLNEREIRAAAGLLFLMMFIAIQAAGGRGDFTILKYSVIIFLLDISIRVFINPKFAPFLVIGRWITRNQVPEYVGATQKKFAWVIGFILAITMLIHLNVLNTYSPITGLICFICLIFLFFEAAFGICLGCKTYSWIYKEKAQYCPGEVCEVKDRHEIQKTNLTQWLAVIVLIAIVFLVYLGLNETFMIQPGPLFGPEMEFSS